MSEGTEVKEFYVLAVQLKHRDYDIQNIAQLKKLIPQNIVFALQYDDWTQFAVCHTKLFTSTWQPTEEAVLSLSGLSLDVVWENIIKQIGQIEVEGGRSLTEQIQIDEKKVKLGTQIKLLERKLALEKQPRKKREYFEKIKKMKKIYERIH